jgi:hypothetical protein
MRPESENSLLFCRIAFAFLAHLVLQLYLWKKQLEHGKDFTNCKKMRVFFSAIKPPMNAILFWIILLVPIYKEIVF